MDSIQKKKVFELIQKINNCYKYQDAARVMAGVAEGDDGDLLKYANQFIKYYKAGSQLERYMQDLEILFNENKF